MKNLMEDVPDLPNFSRFHDGYRENPESITLEGDMRTAFFAAYEEDDCEYLALMDPKIDERLKSGPELVSANFVIPYPPGFPIMVPGQVIAAGHDRLHAQARRQGNPWLQQRARAQADQAVGDSGIEWKGYVGKGRVGAWRGEAARFGSQNGTSGAIEGQVGGEAIGE